ncbi:hypothetical protein [Sinisalibacter lacisalsi]|uniref:Uncharacterized protein n=1 Tax=Sinisalibacter lacisalsi TaxID=1526570 RepID=A0ABQ1QCW7_9RHOB|nr:hypothetical protein [Sinisalibacter lacisalsi]GGD22223.1 hypothetical protein GCM10011358_03390 [Sinisalibacter lacisalsi]
MKIKLSPVRHDGTLTIRKTADVLTINGEDFDFGPLPAGATLPQEAIGSPHFAADVERDESGTLCVTLLFPVGANASEAARFPAPITVAADGPINLPE